MSLSNFPHVFYFISFFRIGVLCAYAANQNLSSQVKNIRRYVNSNMRDLHTFANDTPMVREPALQVMRYRAKCCRGRAHYLLTLSFTKHGGVKIDLNKVLLASAGCKRSVCKFALLCCVSCLQQIDYLLSQYATAKNKVIYDLNSE